MENCVFCKIVNDELPSFKIYEDKFTFAFLDNSGDFYGHILVVPKKHYENVFDCSKTMLGHLMNATKKICNHLVNECGFSGVNILNSNGKSAEQTVFHLHIHLIPRMENDNFKIFPAGNKNSKNLDFSTIKNKLKLQ